MAPGRVGASAPTYPNSYERLGWPMSASLTPDSLFWIFLIIILNTSVMEAGTRIQMGLDSRLRGNDIETACGAQHNRHCEPRQVGAWQSQRCSVMKQGMLKRVQHNKVEEIINIEPDFKEITEKEVQDTS